MKTGPPNKLTFFCELYSENLVKLFSDPCLIEQLQSLRATISLGILDFSDERARIVRQLNKNGIPVIAWQLLAVEQGYWYNMSNADQAVSGYGDFIKWTHKHNLRWAGLGVDIEPDISEFKHLLSNKLRIIPLLFMRMFRKKCFDNACKTYHSLVTQMQNDGYAVDSYEFLFMDDDRKAGSCLLGRILGVTDVPANRRVLMLYSSFFRPYGAALLCNYACGADSVAVGSTGGGVELPGMDQIPLNWDEFSRDLRLTRRSCDDIHVFSLEGCVKQGFMEQLTNFDWNLPVQKPQPLTSMLTVARIFSYPILWLTAHPYLTGLLSGLMLCYLF
ncbi:MAG: hypothetical protein QNL62_13360 [Gammaproteobacteria bacterium]|nr:hypothetical protein [Gammaproteobacteria bacterium]